MAHHGDSLPVDRFEPLFDSFQRGGFELYLVGGCVRDYLMGREERTDFDFATDARPEETTTLLEAHGFRPIPIGARFGTIATHIDGATAEITTYRVAESYDVGSRKPRVTFGKSLEADLGRRDLSINAMAMGRDGAIIDPFDGRSAIRERRLEVPGGGLENTVSILEDDPLRLLRIARFASRFAFDPTTDTTEAATRTSGQLSEISHERWKMELDRTLVAPHVARGIAWLDGVGALPVIFPELVGVDWSDYREVLLDRLTHAAPREAVRWSLLVLSILWAKDRDAAPSLDVPIADWPPNRAKRASGVGRRFRFSNDERHTLSNVVGTPLDGATLARRWSRPALRRWYLRYQDDAYAQLDLAEVLARGDATHERATRALRDALGALLAAGDPAPHLPTGLGDEIRARFSLDDPRLIGRAMRLLREDIIDERLDNDGDVAHYLRHLASEETRWR